MKSYDKGLHTLSTAFTIGDDPADPTTITFTLIGNGETVSYVYGTDAEITRSGVGVYNVDYSFEESGYYRYSFIGTGDCEATDADFIIIGSTADLIAQTSIELEDTSNAIFSISTIDRGITKALVTASQYIPNEAKIPVTLTASKDIDISGIRGLIKVIKAEYEIDQEPKEFHNVSKFADTVTMNIGTTPTEGDTAYLYCYLVHTPDTLTVQLLNKVPMLAAAYCGMNWAGDGRTQIQSAIDAIALISSSTDNMTARLTQVASDIGSARTQITAFLTDADTAITAAGTTLETAMTTLGNADTASSIPLTTELSAVDTALGLAITDLDIARSAKADLTEKITTAVEEVNKAIDQARDDIASARTLNNTITVSSNAEAKLQSAALAEINAAQAYLAEIRSESGDSAGVGATSNITGNDINIAMGYLSKARTMLSEIANESSLKASVGIKEVSAANGYINQARAIVSRTVNTINGYLTAASREISLASGYLSQAGGYAKEASARLSVTNVISSYKRWGQQLYGLTIQELKQMAKPKIFHTYTRS